MCAVPSEDADELIPTGNAWYQVVGKPHIPVRQGSSQRSRPWMGIILPEGAYVQVSGACNGWACLHPEELRRRGLPDRQEAWVLMDGGLIAVDTPAAALVSLGASRGHAVPRPAVRSGYSGAGACRRLCESLQTAGSPEDVARENDLAWEACQAHRFGFQGLPLELEEELRAKGKESKAFAWQRRAVG
mmetsp:Transcript_101463/g.180348  ORF Transcript_101463/g.180348 Transcript_101463/m.180348 type:complete len:188 (-) Transcript_101463:36-599(-)